MASACPQCGTPANNSAAFCDACGAKFPAPAVIPASQRSVRDNQLLILLIAVLVAFALVGSFLLVTGGQSDTAPPPVTSTSASVAPTTATTTAATETTATGATTIPTASEGATQPTVVPSPTVVETGPPPPPATTAATRPPTRPTTTRPPATTTRPTTTAPPVGEWPPAGATLCEPNIAVGPDTTCRFATEMAKKVPSSPPDRFNVPAYSEETGQAYQMQCARTGSFFTCRSGNAPLVYLRI